MTVFEFPRISKIDSRHRSALNDALRLRTYDRGEVLFEEGSQFRQCFIIKSGYAKILKENHLGERSFLSIGGPGEFLGEFAIYNRDRYPITAIAVSQLQAYLLDEAMYRRLRDSSVEFLNESSKYLFKRFEHLNRRVACLAVGDATHRLICFMHFLSENFGERHASNDLENPYYTEIPFLLDRQELADAVNLKKETVIRIMSRLAKEGRILTKKDRFILFGKFVC